MVNFSYSGCFLSRQSVLFVPCATDRVLTAPLTHREQRGRGAEECRRDAGDRQAHGNCQVKRVFGQGPWAGSPSWDDGVLCLCVLSSLYVRSRGSGAAIHFSNTHASEGCVREWPIFLPAGHRDIRKFHRVVGCALKIKVPGIYTRYQYFMVYQVAHVYFEPGTYDGSVSVRENIACM